jgi:UPF0755 protein
MATACCLASGVAAVQSGLASLGPPSPSLGEVERVALGVYLLANRGAIFTGGNPPFQAGQLDVEPGTDAGAVAAQLDALGVVNRPDLMTAYLRYRGLDTGIEAGRFRVSSEQSIAELAMLLQEARASRYTITIPEGWRREEVAEALGQLDLGFSAGDFLAATRRPPPQWANAPGTTDNLEGFLFPDTYQLDPRMSAEEVAALMAEDLESRLSDDLLDGFVTQGLTPFEAVALASIVEREAIIPDERPLIASVFLNRLALGIPLQADPTVQFAVGRSADGWWKAPLSAADLQIDSPYNTYMHDGLPPGPIASPGLASLESVAAPADTAYLFFRAACDGSGRHQFATTFEEHVANACP